MRCVNFSADGKLLITAGDDKTVKVCAASVSILLCHTSFGRGECNAAEDIKTKHLKVSSLQHIEQACLLKAVNLFSQSAWP